MPRRRVSQSEERRHIAIALILALVLTSLLTGINFASVEAFGQPILAKEYAGGEIVSYVGIGIVQHHFYPLTTADDPYQGSTEISFQLSSFVMTFVVLGLTIWIGLSLRARRKKRIKP